MRVKGTIKTVDGCSLSVLHGVVVTLSLPRDGGMVEDHGSQILHVVVKENLKWWLGGGVLIVPKFYSLRKPGYRIILLTSTYLNMSG